MTIDARVSRKAGAVALIAVAGVSLTSIPAAANGATARQPAGAGAGVQAPTAPGSARLPSGLSALSWMVADADTGSVLAAKSPHRKLAPASTLKTLFAVTVLPKFSAGTVRRVSSADLAGIGAGSSVVGVQQGRRYTVGDLWRGVFLRSGNDAVHVLAAMNGGWRTTAEEMQENARKLGARDTTVKSPDGYDAPGQVSSAHDLTVFARAGLANEDFARYCATPRATFPAAGGTTQIENTNRLLVGSHGMSRYPGLIGVKNGYTSKAGNTLIAAARRNGRTLLVTVLNPQSKEYNAVYKEAGALLDWGFRTAGTAQPVGTLHAVRAAHDGGGPMSPVAADVTGTGARDGSPGRATLALGAGGAGLAALGLGALLARLRQARARGGRNGGTA
ncbi:D-alanyl-D-alanine carboxypeptidase (penicillin-binding protein 5/6) [Streptomyces sp. SceaMP-e96]|uniref:D-alanyl-D-alanine carboxypeptidase family protein n=1 Tax=unclassified Streptomyces TaxID=2593676 RepID=UPI000823926F|nr:MULTISPECIES: serine hydrolase [unclassified Streptomyces]SCK44379.1 D-alanyl-D-alanine carboxypeptidase (penicillin-binding protein 5/6) [Streptomyces sp. SceaMP-e96]